MSDKLTILIVPLLGHGHFNACIGLAEPLRDRGHNVVFATPTDWKGKLIELGFQEECYSPEDDADSDVDTNLFEKLAHGMAMSPLHQIKGVLLPMFQLGLKLAHHSEKSFKTIVARVKPDVIVIDSLFTYPSLINSGIPWVLSLSVTPVWISQVNVPPTWSGLPVNGPREDWKIFDKCVREELNDLFEMNNAWVAKHGSSTTPVTNLPFFLNPSPYANIYMYPNELDYTEFRPNPPNWHHFEAFVRSSKDHFEIPEQLKDLPGKLVYFSMGSIGTTELGCVKRFVKILGNSPHRFIVSKGLYGDQYDLPSNMWGSNTVPQTKVIPLVDLVITHGGNNTVTEAFYFGKPCIVLPLFCDQHDNAQRIQETGLGLRFPPYQVTEEQLLQGIEKILANDELIARMKSIGSRIRGANTRVKTADLIEKVARKQKL